MVEENESSEEESYFNYPTKTLPTPMKDRNLTERKLKKYITISDNDDLKTKVNKIAIADFIELLYRDKENETLAEATFSTYRAHLVPVAQFLCGTSKWEPVPLDYLDQSDYDEFFKNYTNSERYMFNVILKKLYNHIRVHTLRKTEMSNEFKDNAIHNMDLFLIGYHKIGATSYKSREEYLEPKDLFYAILFGDEIQRSALVVLSYTGMRRSEAMKYWIEDDEDDDFFYVVTPKSKKKAGEPAENKVIPIPLWYKPFFERFAEWKNRGMDDEMLRNILITLTEDNDNIEISHPKGYVSNRSNSNLNAHIMRHTFSTLMKRSLRHKKEVGYEDVVRSILGQKLQKDVLGSSYVHVSEEEQKKLMSELHYFKVLPVNGESSIESLLMTIESTGQNIRPALHPS